MAEISGAGTPINIKLGQVPTTKNPSLNYELQGIYNAVHILSQYLEVLRAGLEGSDTQTPAENIRFRKFLNSAAKQKITAGHIVTVDLNDGLVVKGTSVGAVKIGVFDSFSPYLSGMVQTFYGVAQNDAEIGENVLIGIGPGILKVTGATSGQIVWAAASRGYTYQVSGAAINLYTTELSNDGDIYLGDPKIKRLAGYPQDLSSTVRILGHYLFSPIGVAVADDYVLFSDFLPWTGRVAGSVFELYP